MNEIAYCGPEVPGGCTEIFEAPNENCLALIDFNEEHVKGQFWIPYVKLSKHAVDNWKMFRWCIDNGDLS